MKKLTIAIDGFSSCGKSTLARDLAEKLNYTYIDSGAMYRAVTLYCIENEINLDSIEQIGQVLRDTNIHFETIKGQNNTFLNNRNVEMAIRTMAVSNLVSEVAAISAVRSAMVFQQRKLGEKKGVVMDGRDIGTVVFPNAELKLFLTAAIETRAKRRHEELLAKNISITIEEVLENLQHRDHIDSSREDSPLRKADDAILIDNTNMAKVEQLQFVLELVRSLQDQLHS